MTMSHVHQPAAKHIWLRRIEFSMSIVLDFITNPEREIMEKNYFCFSINLLIQKPRIVEGYEILIQFSLRTRIEIVIVYILFFFVLMQYV